MSSKEPVGEVIEVLAGSRYRIRMQDGKEIMAYLSGKMRLNRVYLILGDQVHVKLDPAGGHATNRVVWRK